MKLSDYEPALKGEAALEQQFSLLDFMSKAKRGGVYRPSRFGVEMLVHEWIRQQLAYRSQMIQDLFTIAFSITELRIVTDVIKNEVFRRGFSPWIPKFVRKCDDCGKDFQDKVDSCDECGSENLRKPSIANLARFEELMQRCNEHGQSLEEVMRMGIDDINISDDVFLLLVKDYQIIEGEVHTKVAEITRLHPALVTFDLHPESGLPKSMHYVCYMHRDFISNEPGVCSECELKLVPAMYKYLFRNKEYYLLEEEIIHASHYYDSQTYGWSPILTIFEKLMTLVGMDRTLYRYFFERRIPASMIMTVTDDPDGLRREREQIEAKMLTNPDYVPWVAVSTRTGRGRTDMVRLFHTLQEMDYLPVRNEIRERISGIYGVSPIWVGVPEARGGLASQSQELQVTSRVVESHQRIFNEKVIPLLLKAFGITDWYFELEQPEEKAEATRLEFMQRRISAARMLFEMGFDVSLRPGVKDLDKINFEIGGKAQQQAMAPPGAPMPGEAPATAPAGEGGEAPPVEAEEGAPVEASLDKKGWKERRRHLQPVGMEEHEGNPSHPRDMPHDSLSRRKKQEEQTWKGSDKDEDDDDEEEGNDNDEWRRTD